LRHISLAKRRNKAIAPYGPSNAAQSPNLIKSLRVTVALPVRLTGPPL
jgi:hypothetical protein